MCPSFFMNLPHQPLSKPLFLPSACVFLFFCFGLFGVGGVLQCSASPTRCRIGQSSLSCSCPLCLPSLTSQYFSFVSLVHAGSPPPPSRVTLANPFWTVRAPFLFGMHDCSRLSVLHAPPPCPMFPNASFLFFAIPHPTVPLLESVGGFKPCFWAIPVLTFEDTTPYHVPHILL
jgi:hypothetical protein